MRLKDLRETHDCKRDSSGRHLSRGLGGLGGDDSD
jgi:hypothetical protein